MDNFQLGIDRWFHLKTNIWQVQKMKTRTSAKFWRFIWSKYTHLISLSWWPNMEIREHHKLKQTLNSQHFHRKRHILTVWKMWQWIWRIIGIYFSYLSFPSFCLLWSLLSLCESTLTSRSLAIWWWLWWMMIHLVIIMVEDPKDICGWDKKLSDLIMVYELMD